MDEWYHYQDAPPVCFIILTVRSAQCAPQATTHPPKPNPQESRYKLVVLGHGEVMTCDVWPGAKLIVGDWIAQWDTKYRAWFYYNVNTEESTWFKPKELSHVIFKNPATKRGKDSFMNI